MTDTQSTDSIPFHANSSAEGLLFPMSTESMKQARQDTELETRSTLSLRSSSKKVSSSAPWFPCYMNNRQFSKVVDEVREAIRVGVNPIRIKQGSSGSYFVRNKNGEIVAVFKPKNEEPYGNLNPKWTKWFHKNCLPCCFGRSCLIPNLGYISEAAASIVDRHLGLHMVPRTEVVELASEAFHYGFWTKKAAKKSGSFPPKIGSFQIFVKGFLDSGRQLPKIDSCDISENSQDRNREFRHDFEKLVILDYIIRNTDRGSDNWLVFHASLSHPGKGSGDELGNISDDASVFHTKIAAIDNGLAFPHKHPDNWRSYPFGWSVLPGAKVPFSKEIIDSYLPVLSDQMHIEQLVSKLRKCFSLDVDFDEDLFQRQMAVVRGQIHNLVECMSRGESPHELLKKPLIRVYVKDGNDDVDDDDDDDDGTTASINPINQAESVGSRTRRFFVELVKKRPYFTFF